MKILVITDVLWRNDNNVGNSYSNIFGGIENVEIANICCQQGMSDNQVVLKCFQISEQSLIKNLINSSYPTGIVEKNINFSNPGSESKLMLMAKAMRFSVFFWIRDIIWSIGRWKSKELNDFIDDFNPDLIFAQLQDKKYQNNITRYVKKYTDKPLVLYVWDDIYSLQRKNFSPFFWLRRFSQRYSARKTVNQAELLYTISEEQKEEYEKCLGIRTELLYKGCDFNTKPPGSTYQNPLRILYTGNLGCGRNKTLQRFCKQLSILNKKDVKAVVYIYSGTHLRESEIESLNIEGTSHFKGRVSSDEVSRLQNDADILLHLESMTEKEALVCRLSFSTKLVDYFNAGKCIFAIGSDICSSIKYLKRNDAAVVAVNPVELETKLAQLVNNEEMMRTYANKAWECGKRNHSIDKIHGMLYNDFKELLER